MRPQGRDLQGPRGSELDQDRDDRGHEPEPQGGDARRYAGGRGRVYRRECAEYRHDRDGQNDEQGRDYLRLREPDAGDLPRCGKGGRRKGHLHRTQRLSESDQQRAGVPWHLPRRIRRAGQ